MLEDEKTAGNEQMATASDQQATAEDTASKTETTSEETPKQEVGKPKPTESRARTRIRQLVEEKKNLQAKLDEYEELLAEAEKRESKSDADTDRLSKLEQTVNEIKSALQSAREEQAREDLIFDFTDSHPDLSDDEVEVIYKISPTDSKTGKVDMEQGLKKYEELLASRKAKPKSTGILTSAPAGIKGQTKPPTQMTPAEIRQAGIDMLGGAVAE